MSMQLWVHRYVELPQISFFYYCGKEGEKEVKITHELDLMSIAIYLLYFLDKVLNFWTHQVGHL